MNIKNYEPKVGFTSSGTGQMSGDTNTVWVTNPANPSETIRVPAVINANGDLVPADPRYNTHKGYAGNPGKKVSVDLQPTNYLVIGGIGLLVAVFIFKGRG
jgi:hypothetical protein